MAISVIWFLFFLTIVFPCLQVASTSRTRQHPQQHHSYRKQANDSRRKLLDAFSCETGNQIDDCWKCPHTSNWKQNPKRLAECGVGYGNNTIGGKNGRFYVVTNSSDDNVVNPNPGTLRYGVIQEEPLWIMFAESMTIVLKEELIMTSDKTVDGRGFEIVLTGKSGITVQYVNNVIIHSLTIHDMKPSGNTEVRSSTTHFGWRNVSDGDGICIFGSSNVWVDHCTLSHCNDGLIDVVEGSTDITISNNLFYDHNEVMLFGHSDDYTPDDDMRVSVLYNVFGEGLVQRMPRCRRGLFEIINNKYEGWRMYAIGGSGYPTIFSTGNQYIASDNPYTKQVTYHPGQQNPATWSTFLWKSEGDQMFNGAFFNITGAPTGETLSTNPSLASQVPTMTATAGALTKL